jgi:UDP-3-O-[3-hydroxymyristoyl] glucosamine N-acyltransferase
MTSFSLTLAQILDITGGRTSLNSDKVYQGLKKLDEATTCDVSFFVDSAYRQDLEQTAAGLVILKPEYASWCSVPVLESNDPYLAYAKLSHAFNPFPQWSALSLKKDNLIHPTAVIADSAILAENVCIGAYVVIEEDVRVGAGSDIGLGVKIGQQVKIGKNTKIYPNVVIYPGVQIGDRVTIHAQSVIGADGFGFAPNPHFQITHDDSFWMPIAQIASVEIGDDVSIGANTCIDRGALSSTKIARGVIIDNLVQIAHNVQIGSYTAIAACTGISGSTRIGQFCRIGGASGFAGHIQIADGVVFGMQSQVTGSVTEKGEYASGTGLFQRRRWQKMVAYLRKLETLLKRNSKGLDSV